MNQNKEKGITLIALIVTITILVILVAVGVKGLAGNDGLIKTTEVSAENYNIASDKSELERIVRGVIVANATLGKDTSLEDIKKALENQTNFVKSVELIQGATDAEDTLLVTLNNRKYISSFI